MKTVNGVNSEIHRQPFFSNSKRLFIFFALIVHSGVVRADGNVSGAEPLIVPVHFHIVENLQMEKEGIAMQSWVSDENIKKVIVPEMNRIWQPAGISFVISSIVHSEALNPVDKEELIDYVVNSHRNDQGRSDPKRLQMLDKLIDWKGHDDHAINIYFVPYLGATSQGNANPQRKLIFLGQYTDKPSGGKLPPEKCRLTEPEPFNQGSLSRTAAHEIGHILGLEHPNVKTQVVFGRLMGGKKSGYQLTPEEITTARSKAFIWLKPRR